MVEAGKYSDCPIYSFLGWRLPRLSACYCSPRCIGRDSTIRGAHMHTEDALIDFTIADGDVGGWVVVPFADRSFKVKIPDDLPDGKIIRLRGQGAVRADGSKGDLLVKLHIKPFV